MKTQTTSENSPSKVSKANISTLERILMVTSGTYLLYNGLAAKNKNLTKLALGSAMFLRGVSGYCPIYDATRQLMNNKASNVNIRFTTMINKPVNEVFDFWHNFENLPKFMNHLDSVKNIDSTFSEWVAKGPMGIGTISWKARIVQDEKNKLLSWISLEESTIQNTGKVKFKDIGGSTELDITISYHAPLGVTGESAAKLLNPYFEKMVQDDVANLKNYLESNNIAPI